MEISQYVEIPNGSRAVKANYKKQVVDEYNGNPFVEALPPIMTPREVVQAISSVPIFSEEERFLDSNIRFHLIQRLFHFFMPLPIHLDLESSISRIIRQSYVKRNPLSPNFARQFYQSANIHHTQYLNSSTANSLVIIGPSGVGKSSTINRILHLYPQVISHTEYRGMHFNQYQVVWLKIECSHDGSIRGIVSAFFRKIDEILGTNYFDKYIKHSRYSVNALLPVMAQVAKNCGLGLLVVDEIQNLKSASSGGAEKMMNFFVNLINEFSLPIVLIGTPSSLGIFQNQFRAARRGAGQGNFFWNRMEKDEYWDLFVQKIWQYQWVRYPNPLSNEINNVLYEESQGIPDILIKLFVMSQIRAISSGQEQITATIIRSVAKEKFGLLQPMMRALKSGDLHKIAQVEDVYIPDIDDFITNESKKIELKEIIESTKNVQHQHKSNLNIDLIKQEVLLRLKVLGIDGQKVDSYLCGLLQNNPDVSDIQQLVQKVLRMWMKESGEVQVDNNEKEDKDIRNLLRSSQTKQDIQATLDNNGYIKKDFL